MIPPPAAVGDIRFRPASGDDAAGVHALLVAGYEVDHNDERVCRVWDETGRARRE